MRDLLPWIDWTDTVSELFCLILQRIRFYLRHGYYFYTKTPNTDAKQGFENIRQRKLQACSFMRRHSREALEKNCQPKSVMSKRPASENAMHLLPSASNPNLSQPQSTVALRCTIRSSFARSLFRLHTLRRLGALAATGLPTKRRCASNAWRAATILLYSAIRIFLCTMIASSAKINRVSSVVRSL